MNDTTKVGMSGEQLQTQLLNNMNATDCLSHIKQGIFFILAMNRKAIIDLPGGGGGTALEPSENLCL